MEASCLEGDFELKNQKAQVWGLSLFLGPVVSLSTLIVLWGLISPGFKDTHLREYNIFHRERQDPRPASSGSFGESYMG